MNARVCRDDKYAVIPMKVSDSITTVSRSVAAGPTPLTAASATMMTPTVASEAIIMLRMKCVAIHVMGKTQKYPKRRSVPKLSRPMPMMSPKGMSATVLRGRRCQGTMIDTAVRAMTTPTPLEKVQTANSEGSSACTSRTVMMTLAPRTSCSSQTERVRLLGPLASSVSELPGDVAG